MLFYFADDEPLKLKWVKYLKPITHVWLPSLHGISN